MEALTEAMQAIPIDDGLTVTLFNNAVLNGEFDIAGTNAGTYMRLLRSLDAEESRQIAIRTFLMFHLEQSENGIQVINTLRRFVHEHMDLPAWFVALGPNPTGDDSGINLE
jgi:hypothetical protein